MILTFVALLNTLAMVPRAATLMGSPATNLPSCLNGGRMSSSDGRYKCICPLPEMDVQCKLTRVTVGGQSAEISYGPIQVDLKVEDFHLSLQYITNEATGNGSILTVKSLNRTPQLHVFLHNGRPAVTVSLTGAGQTIQFTDTVAITNDNAWHHLDIFIKINSASQTEVSILLDRCRGMDSALCMLRHTLGSTSSALLDLGGYVQLGSDNSNNLPSFDGCLDRVILQRNILDFYPATRARPSIRGCPNADQGCIKNGMNICGAHGTCQNALRKTDMLTCLCEPGFQPDVQSAIFPHRWSCNNASMPWSTTAAEYNARFLNRVPARLRLSVRTRELDFDVFVATSWKISLSVAGGIPTLQSYNTKLNLNKVNVSDGNWHLFDVTFTSKFINIQVDEFDNDFYAAAILDFKDIPEGPTDFVIAKDAQETCLDDAWVDFVNTWKNTEHDYPLEVISNPGYTRRVDWDPNGRIHSCSAGTPNCLSSTAKGPCHPTATCVEEWRGYRCECATGMQFDATGVCQPEQCVPNPCAHGQCIGQNFTSITTGLNFTCTCFAGWDGRLCDQAQLVESKLFEWWWILLIVLLALFFIILLISLIVCLCRSKSDEEEPSVIADDGNLGRDRHLQDPWDYAGEKDFVGHINYAALNGFRTSTKREPEEAVREVIAEPVPRLDETEHVVRLPRDHGQKTSDIPPWEKFEVEDTTDLNLDQALEYGYEGFDGKPPPEFCAEEPLEDITTD